LIEDLRAGLGPATTINVNSEGRRLSPLDFFPWHSPATEVEMLPPAESAEEEARRKILALASTG